MSGQSSYMARIQKEVKRFVEDLPGEINCYPESDENWTNFNAIMKGPADTPYHNGKFLLRLTLPEKYPFDPPQVQFLSKVYHPNVDDRGRICLDILKSPPQGTWKSGLKMASVLLQIYSLLSNPNPDDPLSIDVAIEYKNDRALFDQTAKEYTEKYATGKVTNDPTNSVSKPVESIPLSSMGPTGPKKILSMRQLSANGKSDGTEPRKTFVLGSKLLTPGLHSADKLLTGLVNGKNSYIHPISNKSKDPKKQNKLLDSTAITANKKHEKNKNPKLNLNNQSNSTHNPSPHPMKTTFEKLTTKVSYSIHKSDDDNERFEDTSIHTLKCSSYFGGDKKFVEKSSPQKATKTKKISKPLTSRNQSYKESEILSPVETLKPKKLRKASTSVILKDKDEVMSSRSSSSEGEIKILTQFEPTDSPHLPKKEKSVSKAKSNQSDMITYSSEREQRVLAQTSPELSPKFKKRITPKLSNSIILPSGPNSISETSEHTVYGPGRQILLTRPLNLKNRWPEPLTLSSTPISNVNASLQTTDEQPKKKRLFKLSMKDFD